MVNIFIADDSIMARKMIINLLQADESLQVKGEAETGQGTVILISGLDIDLLILEAGIAGDLSVVEIIEAVREIHPQIKVILLTADLTKQHIIPASEAGATAFLHKPYKKDLALQLIQQVAKGD